MSDWLAERINLGKTELMVGRLGLGAAYGAPTKSFEAAFDAGCNYFYWGALRHKKMTEAIRNIAAKGKRDDLVLVIQDFRRSPKGLEKSLMRGLKKAGTDYADVLLLGWHKKPPKPKVLDAAEKLRKQGLFKHLGLSSHNRTLFPELAKDPRYDVFHLRYNAANRGAEEDLFPHLPEERPGNVIFQATRRMSLAKSNKIPADEKRPTAGDCYRFVLSSPYVDVVITGPSKAQQLEENLVEVAKGPMTAEELVWMRRIGDTVYGRKSK
jgi:aryl-alcohol dehydrogenase-like predicted oxidoreductase